MLDNKLKFIELACTIAYLAKCNIKDTFGPVKTWDIFIYNYLKAKDIVVTPNKQKPGGEFEGAWVKEPVPGFYGWTMSFDFASLYPSIIRQWNMSPETIVGVAPEMNVETYLKACNTQYRPTLDGDFTIAANGAMFRKDKLGIVPEVVKVVLDGRKIAKREMLEKEKQLELIKNELRIRGIE
jgi:DNA polymerase elongation subunit (family B)